MAQAGPRLLSNSATGCSYKDEGKAGKFVAVCTGYTTCACEITAWDGTSVEIPICKHGFVEKGKGPWAAMNAPYLPAKHKARHVPND